MAGDTTDPVEPFRVSRSCGVPAADRTRRDAESTPSGLYRGLGAELGGNYALLAPPHSLPHAGSTKITTRFTTKPPMLPPESFALIS